MPRIKGQHTYPETLARIRVPAGTELRVARVAADLGMKRTDALRRILAAGLAALESEMERKEIRCTVEELESCWSSSRNEWQLLGPVVLADDEPLRFVRREGGLYALERYDGSVWYVATDERYSFDDLPTPEPVELYAGAFARNVQDREPADEWLGDMDPATVLLVSPDGTVTIRDTGVTIERGDSETYELAVEHQDAAAE